MAEHRVKVAASMIEAPAEVLDVFLQPGEVYFGDRNTRIRTVLGSCVAITVWHRVRAIGGMCHFMLPERRRKSSACLDGRYARDAVALLLREIHDAGSHTGEYEAKLFGGGAMFHDHRFRYGVGVRVGEQNSLAARELVVTQALTMVATDLGGEGHRSIVFDVWSGEVWVRHVRGAASPTHPASRSRYFTNGRNER